MKTSGYWEFNQQIIKDLKLTDVYHSELAIHKGNACKAMTATMVQYL